MITRFLLQQMDYIYFCYGLSFILLAFVCHALSKEPRQRLPWIWLGLFAITHGINEWLDMLAVELGDGRLFAAVRLGLLTLSFVFLLEFGRAGWRALRGRGPGRWIHLPLLAGAVAGGLAGFPGLGSAACYVLGLTGGLWAALTLSRASADDPETRGAISWAAAAMACFALASGVIVPPSAIFPASVVNQDSFLSFTGVPIQLVRGILALLITYVLWIHYEHSKRRALPDVVQVGKDYLRNRIIFSGVMAFILVMGQVFVEIVRVDADRDVRSDLIDITAMTSAALDPDRVRLLTGAASDSGLPEYHHLRGRLLAMGKANPRFRWLYLMNLRGGNVLVTVDSVPEGGFGHAEPGGEGTIYRQPPPELFSIFAAAGPAAVGPYTDEWGTFLSGFAPVRDASSGRVVGVLGIDIDAADWHRTIAKYRLASIYITLMVVLMAMGFFTARLRAWENAQRLAASEQSLEEAQKIAHIGHWTMNTRTNQVTWSAEMIRIFGLDPAGGAPSLEDYRTLIHPEDRDMLDAAIRKLAAEEGRVEQEFRLLPPGGPVRHILAKMETRRTARGDMLLLGASQDITGRKQVELELASLRQRIEFILGATRTGLDIIDTEYNMVYIDPEWRKVYGDFHGRKCYEYFAGRREMCPNCGIPEVLRSRQPVVSEETLPREGNRCIQVTSIPFQNDEGEWLVAEVNVDITERKKAEQALRESEERFVQVAETAGEWIWEVDAAGLYRYSSSAVEKILGYSPDELVGRRHFYDLFPPDEREEMKAAALAAFERRETFRNFINANLHRNGTVVLLETSGAPVLDEGGNVLGYRGTDTDITAARQAEEALRKSEEYYRRLLDVSPDGVTITDLQGNLVYASPKARSLYGIPAATILRGTPALNWIAPEFREQAQDRIRKTAMGDLESAPMLYRLVRQDGTWFWGDIISAALHDASGRPTGILSLIRDITARKRAEEEVKAARAFLDSTINAIADPIFVKDAARRFVLVNDALCAIVGRPREGLLGEDGDDMFPRDQVEVFRRVDAAILETGEENINEELLSNLSTGEVRTIVTRKSRYVDPGGKRFIVGVIRDITERKRADEDREKLIAELGEALGKVRTLSGFLPICANCKKIRDDKGYWKQIESYIRDHSEAEFSHGICPECAKKFFPDHSGT